MEEMAIFTKFGENKEFDEDMVLNDLQSSKKRKTNDEKILSSTFSEDELLLLQKYTKEWKDVYSLSEIEKCISKITSVSYNQILNIFGSFKVMAVSSGFSLGSANWIIQTEFEKIVYISSSSSAASRHPEPLTFLPLKEADVAIITDVNTEINKDAETMLSELCRNIGMYYHIWK